MALRASFCHAAAATQRTASLRLGLAPYLLGILGARPRSGPSVLFRSPLRFFLSRCTPSATAHCSPRREKCRWAVPCLFFRLCGSLCACSRALRASLCHAAAAAQRTASLRLGLAPYLLGILGARPRSGPSVLFRSPLRFSVCTAGAGESFPRP